MPEPVTCMTRFFCEDVRTAVVSPALAELPNLAPPVLVGPPRTALSQYAYTLPSEGNPEPGFVIS